MTSCITVFVVCACAVWVHIMTVRPTSARLMTSLSWRSHRPSSVSTTFSTRSSSHTALSPTSEPTSISSIRTYIYGEWRPVPYSKLALLKSTFNCENFTCRLSWSISDFHAVYFLKCVWPPQIANKFTKTPILGVQGRSRSPMLVPLESLSAGYDMQQVCLSATVLSRLDDSSRNRAF